MSQGLMGATLISQYAAREYLKSINQSYSENSQVDYMEGWRNQIDDISLNYDKVDIIDFELKFTKLKQSYPNLFAVIKKHLLKSDVVENNLTEEKLTSSFFYKLLHSDVITFFYCVSQLKMEGVLIDFDMLELRGEYIKIGELWLNSDGDELYIRPYEASVYFHDIGKNQIHIINKSFNLFIENDLSRFVYENAQSFTLYRLVYHRFRYYDPNSGNYIGQDPISIVGGLNTYAYVHDFSTWIDSFGLSSNPIIFTSSSGQTHQVSGYTNLSHMSDAQLNALYHANNNAPNGKGFGLSGVDKQGNTIVLHHYKQNPNGDLIAMPAKHHDKPHTNPGQHPFGKQKGTGLTPDERIAFNKWKQEYWKSQTEAKLKARGKKIGCH